MKYVLLIPRLIYRVYFILVFFLVMIIAYPIFKIWIKRGAQYDKVFSLEKKLALIIQWLSLAPQIIISENKFPKAPYIVISNHTSYLDIVHMYTLIPDFYLFLGKSEILRYPIIKIFFKGMNIPVKRGSIRASKEAQETADRKLKEGKSLSIFPEGGIFGGAPALNSFKNGAFKLAIKNNVPIVPITFLNNWKLMGDFNFFFDSSHPGLSRTIIHESIPTDTLNEKDLIFLRTKCKDIIEAPLRSHYPKYFDEDGSK